MNVVSKDILQACVTLVAPKSDDRFYLHGLHLEGDMIGASSGSVGGWFKVEEWDAKNYPTLEGLTVLDDCNEAQEIIIPLDAVAAAIKACKKSTLPIMDNKVLITPTSIIISTGSEENINSTVISYKPIDAGYPNLGTVIDIIKANRDKELASENYFDEKIILQAFKAASFLKSHLRVTQSKEDNAVLMEMSGGTIVCMGVKQEGEDTTTEEGGEA